MKQYTLHQVYKTASMVEDALEFGVPFTWKGRDNNSTNLRNAAISFQRITLLHYYIRACFTHHYHHYFNEMSQEVIDDVLEMQFLEEQFSQYNVLIDFLRIKYDEFDYPTTSRTRVRNWYASNKNKFFLLSEKLSEDVFFILFSNRSLLQKFNSMVAANFEQFKFPSGNLSRSGKLKRIHIPVWVKTAVYHRDKGRCVFCSTDLSGVINALEAKNYDHIIPLDRMGVNDPTNIQLLCSKCNLEKLNRNTNSSSMYAPWFQ